MAHLYKSRLQTYAQKRNIPFPTYTVETQGPPHARLFKSQVTIDGNTYTGPEFCTTLKDAEHAAAKVALSSLSLDGAQEDDCMYKSLLQELAQKKGLRLPVYTTDRTGPPHIPCFVSKVEISGESYAGEEARTKKQSEMNAAKVAYTALTEGGPRASNATAISNIAGTSGSSSLQTVMTDKKEPINSGPRANNAAAISNIVGTSGSGSFSLQTVMTHKNEPTTSGPRANNAIAISNIVGTSGSGSSSLQTPMTHKNEPTTSKMQTIINNRVSYTIPNDPEKAKGYLELKDLQDAMEKHTMTLPPVIIHQPQPKSTPNVVDLAKPDIKQKKHVIQAGEGPGSNGKKIQPFVNEATLNAVMDSGSAMPHSTKIVIRPHVQGMTYDGHIQVSDDEWVAMKVNVDDGMQDEVM